LSLNLDIYGIPLDILKTVCLGVT